MPIMGTEGGDDIEVVEEWEASGETETTVEALGGNDLITFRFDIRDTPDGDPDPDPFHVDGGSGTDILRFVVMTDAEQDAVVDARTGNLVGLTYEAVERLFLYGGGGDDELYGGDTDDQLAGRGGHNVLGGGAGNDVYIVEHSSDVIAEDADEGTDTVRSHVSKNLPANFEHLILVPGSIATLGRGNELDNEITGNENPNTLEGMDGDDLLDGGTGADILRGGRDDDVYVVDHVQDSVAEVSGELGGIDTVRSSISYTLGAFTENLVLTGSSAIDGTGNSLNNEITGNSAANRLAGGDSPTGDEMTGLGGNDTYIANSVLDDIFEAPSGGFDTVISSDTHFLSLNVERLILTGTFDRGGFGNNQVNSITGNSGDNTIRGHGGNDALRGGAGDDRIFGGKGNDSLRGDAGTDRFYFDTQLNASTNVDHLVNYTPADDWIILDLDVFEGIDRFGLLHPSAFRLGTSAQDSSDRILYDPATGKLRYDEDGVGGEAAILFATVPDGTPVTYADFFTIG